MGSQKIAIVTGGNKGIGFAIVKGLCEKFEGNVYLTSRDVFRGEEAIKKLTDLGFKPHFHQLDVDDLESVIKFREYLTQKYDGIDVLVNNAGIAFNGDATEPFGYQAEVTLRTNYFSLLNVCHELLPLIKPNGKVVNVSSSCGHLSKIPSPELRSKFANPELTEQELSELMTQFVEAAKEGKNSELGWGTSAYNISKVGVSALTRIQQREADKEEPIHNIFINSVHPGYVDTDMTNHKGVLTLEEGAKAPLFLALEDHKWKGQYVWKDATQWDWLADKTPSIV